MSRRRARVVGQTVTCGWCGKCFELAATGRIPKWCSQACRQRACEQRRAARSGLAAVDVVTQTIEVEKRVEVHVVERVEVPINPKGPDWPRVLAELVDQLDRGRVYDRDLAELEASLNDVLAALQRRPALRRRQPPWQGK